MMAAMGRKAGDMTLDKWQRMTEWFMTALALVFLFISNCLSFPFQFGLILGKCLLTLLFNRKLFR